MHSVCFSLAAVNCKCGCCYLCCTDRYSALHGGLNLGAPLVFACFGWSPFNFKWRSTGLGQALIYITKKDPIIKYSKWTSGQLKKKKIIRELNCGTSHDKKFRYVSTHMQAYMVSK